MKAIPFLTLVLALTALYMLWQKYAAFRRQKQKAKESHTATHGQLLGFAVAQTRIKELAFAKAYYTS
jgi:hypothetical protein